MPNYLTTKLTVHSDGYQYDVELGEELSLTYFEPPNKASITFGSIEEMEAVAKAMLKAVKFHKET